MNMPMGDKTVLSKGYVFVSDPKNVCNELLKLNEVKFYGSQIKIEYTKSTIGKTIVVSFPATNQPVVVNKNLDKQNSQQKLPSVPCKWNYCEVTLPGRSPYNTLIFKENVRNFQKLK